MSWDEVGWGGMPCRIACHSTCMSGEKLGCGGRLKGWGGGGKGRGVGVEKGGHNHSICMRIRNCPIAVMHSAIRTEQQKT